MPRYKIKTTAQVHRIYFVDAPDADEAERLVCEADIGLQHEEDVSEEVDDVSEVKTAKTGS